MTDKEHKFPVIELFGPTVQGEGHMCGTITHFLRLGGCTYECSWCDSMHAVDPAQIKANRVMMTGREIADKFFEMEGSEWVTISGGDPCIHKHLEEVIIPLKEQGYKVAIETQGAIYRHWLMDANWVTISPKGPSSGMETDHNILMRYVTMLNNICLKIVIFTPEDYDYAYELHKRYPRTEMFLQPGTDVNKSQSSLWSASDVRNDICDRTAQVIEWVMSCNRRHTKDFGPKVKIIPQVHTLIWPTEHIGR